SQYNKIARRLKIVNAFLDCINSSTDCLTNATRRTARGVRGEPERMKKIISDMAIGRRGHRHAVRCVRPPPLCTPLAPANLPRKTHIGAGELGLKGKLETGLSGLILTPA
ncbi:MAG: hypothetical protein LBD58_09990, partial [Treponema sp.]|nr:hypothetical protein [Treponema sp.]